MHAQLNAADARVIEESGQACCYATSDKYWVTDPTGIAWETFHCTGNSARSVIAESLLNRAADFLNHGYPGIRTLAPAALL